MGKASTKSKRRKSSSSKSRVRKSSKIRRSKSKKDYCHADDDSRSLVSVSSFSSDSSDRNRRSRSHSRKPVKGSKKRAARSQSSSRDSSPPPRKRKGSRRKEDYDMRKKTSKSDKTKKRKKDRRDHSISSSGNVSCSCSDCQNLSDGSEYESRRYRSKRRGRDSRKLEKAKGGSKRGYRSRSFSSCDRYSESSENYGNDAGGVGGDRPSKRLRSVIVRKEDNDDGEFNRDEQKEEMEYDHDEYPCRSNDSNDVGNKTELAHKISDESEKKRHMEDKKTEKGAISGLETTNPTEIQGGVEGQCPRNDFGYDRLATKDGVKEQENDRGGADDLESILRQKALENLRTFRGWIQTNSKCVNSQKDECGSEVKPSTTKMTFQTKSGEVDSCKVLYGTQNNEKLLDDTNTGSEPVSVNKSVYPPCSSTIGGKDKISATVVSGISKPRLVRSALKQALTNPTTAPKGAPVVQEHNTSKHEPDDTVIKVDSAASGDVSLKDFQGEGAEILHSEQNTTSENVSDKVADASSSATVEPYSLTPATVDVKLQDEGKEGQLEQRTMSVMRGGEVVQVSYKVYIPKKTPALARRKLKR